MSDLTRRFSTEASTAPTRFDVVGIGNALVDVIAPAEDHFLDRHDLVKGSMTLIETERAVELYAALDRAVEMSGGSAANTVVGVASLGGRAAYIGKVNGDDLGDVFGHDMRAVGVTFHRPPGDHGTPTGRCVIVVTPDAERTMNTFLGVSSELCVDDLDESVVIDMTFFLVGFSSPKPCIICWIKNPKVHWQVFVNSLRVRLRIWSLIMSLFQIRSLYEISVASSWCVCHRKRIAS